VFLLEHLDHTRVDAVLHQQTDDFNASLLSEAVDASNGLRFKSWIEAWFHKKDTVCLRQVDTHCTSTHTQQENSCRRIVLKLRKGLGAILHGHVT
jgi:hypothetical protein